MLLHKAFRRLCAVLVTNVQNPQTKRCLQFPGWNVKIALVEWRALIMPYLKAFVGHEGLGGNLSPLINDTAFGEGGGGIPLRHWNKNQNTIVYVVQAACISIPSCSGNLYQEGEDMSIFFLCTLKGVIKLCQKFHFQVKFGVSLIFSYKYKDMTYKERMNQRRKSIIA